MYLEPDLPIFMDTWAGLPVRLPPMTGQTVLEKTIEMRPLEEIMEFLESRLVGTFTQAELYTIGAEARAIVRAGFHEIPWVNLGS